MQPARYLVLSLLTFWAVCGIALSRGNRSKYRQNLLAARAGHGKGHKQSHGFGQGNGQGHGYGHGRGHGHGNGKSHGHGNGRGQGHSYGFGQGHGFGHGQGHGHSHGFGQGYGHGKGHGHGHFNAKSSSKVPDITVLTTTFAPAPAATSTAVPDISGPETTTRSTTLLTSAVAPAISSSETIVGSSATPTSTTVPETSASKTRASSTAAPKSTVASETFTTKAIASSTSGPSSTTVPGTTCRCGVANSQREKVASGEPGEKNEFPWLVAVVDPGASEARCSATLLNRMYAITKQFGCGEDGGELIIDKHLTTEGDEQMQIIIDIVISCPHAANCVLLKLGTPIVFPSDNSVAPICLPLQEGTDNVGTRATVASWRHDIGSDASLHWAPRKFSVTVAPSANCQAIFRGFTPSKYELCVSTKSKKRSTCGDEGGPLMHVGKGGTYSIIGVLTLGNFNDSARSEIYTNSARPEIYTRVTPHLAWLRKQIADGECCAKS